MKIQLKYLFQIGILSFLLTSCLGEQSSNNNEQENEGSLNQDAPATVLDQQLCFLSLDGTRQQDSTYVYIRLKGDSVNGIYHWVPEFKDARRGTIAGIKRKDTIDVVWNYMQEGVIDTLHTVFILQNGNLKQQPYAITSEGKQVLDRNAAFDITYKAIPCPPDYK